MEVSVIRISNAGCEENGMRNLLVYLKDYKKETVLAPFFKMLEASFELLVPLVMAYMIDQGIGGKDQGVIFRVGLVLIS